MSKKIYILLSQTGTYFSRAIRTYTKYPYNHVSIALNEELEPLYSFGRKFFRTPLPAGFVKEYINKGVYRHLPDTQCRVYEIEVNHWQYEEICATIDEFNRRSEIYRYSLINVLTMALKMKYDRKRHFVCSSFVALLLERCNVASFKKPLSLILPSDFEALPNTRIVYEGLLNVYGEHRLGYA